jgi:transposase
VFHRNARLTVHGRLLIVQRYQAGWRQAPIAAAMGVSRKCVKTWIDRHDSEGEAGLQTRSSRPHVMPTKTPPEVEQKVLDARAEHRDGPDVLGPRVGVPARTVSRILRRHRVPYLRQCDPMTGEVIRFLEGQRGPLRTRQAWAAGPHRRQEARPHTRRWGLADRSHTSGRQDPRAEESPARLRLRALTGR